MTARTGLFIILAVTLWRIITLHFDTTDFFVDEAQYWFWSQNLDFGYYSKPPMIAWFIRAMTELSGSDDIFWVRLCGPLVHMATAFLLMKLAGRVAGPKVEGWTGAIYITMPAVALSSVFFSTDVVLLFFMTIGLWAYFGLTEKRSIATCAHHGRCLRLLLPVEIRDPFYRARRTDRAAAGSGCAHRLARLLHIGHRRARRRCPKSLVELHPRRNDCPPYGGYRKVG